MSTGKILSITALAAAALLTPVVANAADLSTAPAVAVVNHSLAKPATTSQHAMVVRAGQRVNIGRGASMTLTRTERCVTYSAGSTCKSVNDGNQSAGTVSLQRLGALYSPLYIGSGKATRMVVQEDGKTYQTRVVTLAGHPGYATGYAWGTPPHSFMPKAKVTVYDASGKVLAHL